MKETPKPNTMYANEQMNAVVHKIMGHLWPVVSEIPKAIPEMGDFEMDVRASMILAALLALTGSYADWLAQSSDGDREKLLEYMIFQIKCSFNHDQSPEVPESLASSVEQVGIVNSKGIS